MTDDRSSGEIRYFLSLEGLEASGQHLAMVTVSSKGLLLEVAGRAALELAYADLNPDSEASRPGRWVLRTRSFGAAAGGLLILEDPRLLEQVRREAPAGFQAALETAVETGRIAARKHRIRFWIQRTVLTALTVGLLSFGYDGLVHWAVAKVPLSYEEKLGAIAWSPGQDKRVEDPLVTGAVEQIGGRLLKSLPGCPYSIHFYVVEDSVNNAFALPGGTIVIFSGLIAEARDPDELAGVLAHEIQHVLGRHGLHQMIHSAGLSVIFMILTSNGGSLAQLAGRAAPQLVGQRYSRGEEREADLRGLALLKSAGIPGEGMVHYFERLAASEGKIERATAFWASHPTNRRRQAYLRKWLSDNAGHPSASWDFDWSEIRRRCGTVVLNNPVKAAG